MNNKKRKSGLPFSKLACLVMLWLSCSQALAALDVSMSTEVGYPNPIVPGEVTALRITLQNSNDTAPITGVTFTNNMPAEITVAGGGAVSYSCQDGDGNNVPTNGTVTATIGTSTIELGGGGGTIPQAGVSSGRCDIVVEVTSTVQNAAHTNTIPAGAVTGNDGQPQSNATKAEQSITVTPLNNPSISKSFSKNSIVVNDETVRLTLTIDNRDNNNHDLPLNTAADTPAFGLRDTLPAGLQVAADPNIGISCTSGNTTAAFNPLAGDTVLTVVGGAIPADAACSFSVDLVGTSTGAGYSQALSNTVNRNSDFANKRGLVPSSNASDTVTVRGALNVSKAFSPATVRQSEQATLTITLQNDSTLTPLTGVQLTENNIRTSGSGSGTLAINNIDLNGCGAADVATINGGQGFALGGVTPGTIDPDSSCVLTITYTPTLGTAGEPETFTDAIPEGAVANNEGAISRPASHSVTVLDELSVSKSRSPAQVVPGNPVRYDITVRNYSGGALNDVQVTDNLPGGMLALATPAPSMSGSGCAGTLSHDIAGPVPSTTSPHLTFDMNAGVGASPSVCTVSFWAMLPSGAPVAATFVNQIGAGGVCSDNGAGGICNAAVSSTSNITVTATAPVTVNKNFSPNNASEGMASELTVTFTNASAEPLTDVQFTDNLPIGSTGLQLRVADPAVASSNCAGAVVTANPGDAVVTMTGGTIPARADGGLGAFGTCELKVNVIGAAGNYTNVLPAGAVQATHTRADASTETVSSPGPVQATLNYASALGASKRFTPDTVQSGGRSTVAIRLSNSGDGTLNDVSVTDPLPAGMVLADPPNAYTTCGGSSTITAVAGQSSVELTGAIIPPGGQCEFLFDVQTSGSGDWVNTIPAGNITAAGGVQTTSPVQGTLLESTDYAITITNNAIPNSLTAPGERSVLTLTLTNSGTADLSGIAFTDYFTDDGTSTGTLTGMLAAATPNIATTCSGGVVTVAPDGSSVSLSGASLNGGDSCTVSLDVTMQQVGTVQDVIPPGVVQTDQGVSNTLETITSLSAQANIGVAKQFIPEVVKPDQRARLRLTFINPLTLPVANLAVLDSLPAGVTVPAGPNLVTDCSGATVTTPGSNSVQVSGGNLPAASGGVSSSCMVELDVVAAAQGSYTNVIPSHAVTGTVGGAAVDNPSPTEAVLQVREPVSLSKSFAPASVPPGQPSTLTITIDNPSDTDLTGAALTDNLPADLVVALTPNASTTCAGGTVTAPASATAISLSGATIPATGSCQVQVDTLSNTAGSYVNTIPAGSLNTAEGVTNEEPASDTLEVSMPPVVSKQFSPPAIPAGGTSTLTIVLTNDNGVDMTTTAHFTDELPIAPGPVVVATPPNASTTCTGTLVANAGAATVRLNSGATIPAGGCSISVDVTGNTAGTHINYIPAAALQTDLGDNLQPADATLEISALGYISGRVFQDNNVAPNGTYDSGTDTPLAGVTVNLRDAGDNIIATTVTDALGNYQFTGLAAGTYSVEQPNQPAGTVNGITTPGAITGGGGGTPGTATPTATTPSRINGITLGDAGGQIDGSPDNTFAEQVNSTISGSVFLDQNNNGLFNGADSGLESVTIELLDGGGNLIATTQTDAAGNYSFTDLEPGTYSIRQPSQPTDTSNGITTPGTVGNGGTTGVATAPTVTPSLISNLVLPPNTVASGNNFAELPNSRRISGSVFLDFDNNGTLDGADHGIAGETINLTGTDANGNPVSLTTTTDSDGNFEFTGLPEGTYQLDQPTQPASTGNGTTTAGSAGGVASNPTATTSRVAGIDLTGVHTVSGGNTFAERPDATVDLALAKTHSPASLAEGSTTGFYRLTPSNIGSVDTSGTITVVDTLPAGISILSMPTSGDWSCAAAGQVITCTSDAVIPAAGVGSDIILRVAVDNGLSGQLLVNHATISGGSEPPGFESNNQADDPTPIAEAAEVAGHIWFDNNHDRVMDPGESLVPDWQVDLVLGGVTVASTTTDSSGAYNFTGISPGSGYQIRFREPDSGTLFGRPVPNEVGAPFVPGVADPGSNPAGADNSDGTLDGLTLASGDRVTGQSLPLDPSGVVYDSITRAPVAGAVVTLAGPGGFNPATHLVGGAANVSQTTGANGYYQYLLNAGAPAGTYTITVTSPPTYLPGESAILPACNNALNVAALPDPALVQDSVQPPAVGAPVHDPLACPAGSAGLAASANSTQYYFSFDLNPGVSADLVNNHIPLDPITNGAFTVQKTTPMTNVSRGDLVPYTVTVTNNLAGVVPDIDIRDQIPPGFKYKTGSASMDGVKQEPLVTGRLLTWPNLSFALGQQRIFKMMLVVGAGVSEGEYVNQAWAENNRVAARVSNLATATVRVVPDPTFDCSDLIGKVFDDQNANGYQDQGEPGIANARVATARGLLVTTDDHGRFHVTCAAIPNEWRGGNFILKLDERSLPSGYRVTTENPRVVRLTRGKISKANFGATIHRVVRLDLTSDAFMPGNEQLLEQWNSQLDHLVELLHEQPSVLRLSYQQTVDDPPDLVQARIDAVQQQITARWEEDNCCYPLTIEVERMSREAE